MSSILYNFTPEELQNLLDTSNSYGHLLKRIGLNPKGGNPETLKHIISEYNLSTEQLDINRHNLFSEMGKKTNSKMRIDLKDVFDGKVKYQSSYNLLQRLFNEGYKERKCENCGITEWLGKPIAFHLHHEDGNHNNNALSNLKVLCPNCHSQTDNFAGKSRKAYKDKKDKRKIVSAVKKSLKLPPITREELKRKIRSIPFTSIAGEYGVTDNAIRKWCDKYQLPRKKSVIQTYSDEEWDKV